MPFLLLPLFIIGGILFYIFAVASRNTYRCPTCGEEFAKMEYMSAMQCNMCGASLEKTEEISDSPPEKF